MPKNTKFNMKPKPKINCSAREAAQILGVSVRTAQQWVEEGLLQAWKTPGGHRRILIASVERMLAQQVALAGYAKTRLEILLLDSDQVRGNVLGGYLQSALPDCRVEIVQDAVAAILQIGAKNPDIVVIDFDALPLPSLLEILNHPQLRFQSRLLVVIGEDEAAISSLIPANTTLMHRQLPPDELLRLLDAFKRGCRHREQLT